MPLMLSLLSLRAIDTLDAFGESIESTSMWLALGWALDLEHGLWRGMICQRRSCGYVRLAA